MSKHNTKLYHALPTAGHKHNQYCGPAALAAFTGLTTGDSAALLRGVSGKRSIRGTSDDAMLDALETCGMGLMNSERFYPHRRMTLNNWLRQHYDGNASLVSAGHHWLAFQGECFVDSFFRLPTPVDKVHMKRAQVREVYHLCYE